MHAGTTRSTDGDDGVGELIAQLADDAKGYATAQAALYKTIFAIRAQAAKIGLIYGAVAAVIGLAAVGALLVGLILAMATLVGPLAATAIVIVLALAVAGLLGWLAAGHLAKAFGEIE